MPIKKEDYLKKPQQTEKVMFAKASELGKTIAFFTTFAVYDLITTMLFAKLSQAIPQLSSVLEPSTVFLGLASSLALTPKTLELLQKRFNKTQWDRTQDGEKPNNLRKPSIEKKNYPKTPPKKPFVSEFFNKKTAKESDPQSNHTPSLGKK